MIKGHTQNEGDNVHSVIEKKVKSILKSGPIYTPPEYVGIIRSAKVTGRPYKVREMCHSDFIDWVKVTEEIGKNFTKISKEDEEKLTKSKDATPPENNTEEKDSHPDKIKMCDIKVLKVVKNEPCVLFVKTSYEQKEFLKIEVAKQGKKRYLRKELKLSKKEKSTKKKN